MAMLQAHKSRPEQNLACTEPFKFYKERAFKEKNRVRAFVSFSSFRLCHHCKFSKFLDCARETNLQCINCLAEIPKNRFALGKVEESTDVRYALPI